MIDEALVIDVGDGLARVRVRPQSACCDCSAHAVCQGGRGTDGTMTALNPLRARPGDAVRVEIPEEEYNREALRLFGGWLLSLLAGLGLGSLASFVLHTPPSVSAAAGAALGLAAGGFGIWFSRRGRRRPPYPVIREIMNQGAGHEPT